MRKIFTLCLVFAVSTNAQQIIKADGSSTVYPITKAAADEFQKAKKDAVKVTIGISGTGGGFRKFCAGEIDISNASRPILSKEMEACAQKGITYIEIPIAFDGLAVVVNSGNNWAKCMTGEQLRNLWRPESQGKTLKWKDLDPNWPDTEVKLCGAGSESGTFDYFTEAIVGRTKASRKDYFAAEDDNTLVQFASREKGALCYIGLNYAEENKGKIRAVEIRNPRTGECVAPSYETVRGGKYQPLSRPLFIYVNAKAIERPEVKEFVEFYLKNAEKLVRQANQIPFPSTAYATIARRVEQKKTGTIFGGEPEIGVTVDLLIKKEPK